MANDTAFNVLEHELVPEHYLLDEGETEEVLEKLGVTKDQLPKIKRSDMAIKVLESAYGRQIEAGEVIKVIRKSRTAGEFVAYRLVVGS
ncbi:MAG: DNA-directed RNA polymerase subunit H [Thermoplasmatales archaeon]|nr:DNA-directed RNA polymerase subunit H [Thermoplasmatales archaeon]